jgi:hypothetical protein
VPGLPIGDESTQRDARHPCIEPAGWSGASTWMSFLPGRYVIAVDPDFPGAFP